MTVATAYKVRVKIGPDEFDAEGREETVKQGLDDFLKRTPIYADRAAKRPAHDVTDSSGSTDAANNDERVGVSDPEAPETAFPAWDTQLDRQLINRLFKEERNNMVTLRVLPSQSKDKAADTLFLLLFGFLILKGQSEVKATDLLACAKQSGIALNRVDQTLGQLRFRPLSKRGGSRSLSRYALTNPGILHAERIASRIFS